MILTGATAIARALKLACEEFVAFSPYLWQKKRVLLVTDGKETQNGNPVWWANILKAKGKNTRTFSKQMISMNRMDETYIKIHFL